MDPIRTDGRRLWILATPDGRRVGLVANDAGVPVALSRLPRNWDLVGEQDPASRCDVDALVVAVGVGDDPRTALGEFVDESAVIWGEEPTEVVGPVSYLPRSAGLEELADAIDRVVLDRPPPPPTYDERGLANVRSGPPDPPGHRQGDGARRERFRDRMVDLLLGEPHASSTASDPSSTASRHSSATASHDQGAFSLADRVEQLGQSMPALLRLLEEVPVLRSEPSVLDRLLDLCVEQLSVDAAAVWRRQEAGWIAIAHRGLPEELEEPIVVPIEQPLLVELETVGGAVLVRSVADVAVSVEGLPALGEGALAAVALQFGRDRYGLLTVTRDIGLEHEDLRWLRGVVHEAMAGLAVAAGVAKVAASSRSPSPTIGAPSSEAVPQGDRDEP